MDSDRAPAALNYTPPPGAAQSALYLVSQEGTPQEQRFAFCDRIVIGRHQPTREGEPAILLVADATISRRHCIVTRAPDGRFFVRDVSMNGTWLDGRRLVPNVETRIEPGQVISLGDGTRLKLAGGSGAPDRMDGSGAEHRTMRVAAWTTVTVLVGDLRDYTVLVREAPADRLQQSVRRVFAKLEDAVTGYGGAIKEYPGDAMFAFWDEKSSGNHAAMACRAALALNRLVQELAADRQIWDLTERPLQMDWAVTTGRVVIESMGGDRPTGLSMVGEPVVLAFRLEKLADDATGPILACRVTREMAGDGFEFRALDAVSAKGFGQIDGVFALVGERH